MPNIKAHMRERLLEAKSDYLDDLSAMDHEALGWSPGGSARCAYDFTYEVVFVNRRIATRLEGGDPGPASDDGWITAPSEFKNKETAIREYTEAIDRILAAWDATEDVDREIKLAKSSTSPYKLANMCCHHVAYHDGQLNYLQAIRGDDKVHWA